MAAPVAQQPVSANVVGNAFVEQYYHILHRSPTLVHRFYQDISQLGRPQKDGSMSITTTMQAINDKIVSLNYGDFRAVIKSVDTQESFNGGVHVFVTGSLTGKDNKVSDFAQTFFLAPQDKGYFVLNDMFRYVNNTSMSQPLVSDDVVPVAAKPADGYSIYVMDLPMTASEASLEDAFKKFGTIKKDGIQVRSNTQQQFCFGFVEFEEASSVQKAIKALDVLLDMPASSIEHHSGYYESTSREDSQYLLEPNSWVGDKTSDSTSNSSDVGLKDKVWFAGNPFRNDFKASKSSGSHHSTEIGNVESELLKSLFIMPTPKAAKKEPKTMNWGNLVKKMASLGQRFDNRVSEQVKLIHAKGNEYQVLGGAAHHHCDSMKSYSQNVLTGEGRLQNFMAREAAEKASRGIHLPKAVKSFRVITGRGRHGAGKPKLKNSVINLLQKYEGISCVEENPGALLVMLDGQTDFNFLDSDSETE